MSELSDRIWSRIESRMKEKGDNLKSLATDTGLSYDAIRSWRSKKRAPDLDALIAISEHMDISLDYLILGKSSHLSTEQRYIQDNLEARVLVRAIMDNPALLSPLSTIVSSRIVNNKKDLQA